MPPSSQLQKESLSVRLGTMDSEVNAAAVASTMQAVVAIVEEAQKQLQTNEQILLKARPFVRGSFEIPLDLIVVGAAVLFEAHPLLSQILDMLKDYIDIKKLLKGQPMPDPTEAGTTVIQGTTINVSNSVINILSNGRVNSAVSRAVADISADESIRDVTVYRGESPEPFITIPSTEFDYFRYRGSSADTAHPDRDRNVRTTLTLRSPVFDGKGKWKFNYEGNKISADLRDEDFKRRVDAGVVKFAAGDRLEVELAIAERYNAVIGEYERKGFYSITRVLGHTRQPPPPSQSELFDKHDGEEGVDDV